MKYLVVGLYPEEDGKMQRFAEHFNATEAGGAELQCQFLYPDVIIAGVVFIKVDGIQVSPEIADTKTHTSLTDVPVKRNRRKN